MNWIKNNIGEIDLLKAMVYGVAILLITLIISLYATYTKLSEVEHENELLVAQERIWSEYVKDVSQFLEWNGGCDNRFKYDPITGSIYDNETKEIYRKVGAPENIMYRVTYSGQVKGEGKLPFDESIYIEGYQIDFFYGGEK